MKRKWFVMLIVVLSLNLMPSAIFSTTYSNWIPANNFPNAYLQMVNQFNSQQWDGIRFGNQNPFGIKITVNFTHQGTYLNTRTVYVEGGNNYSEILQLGPGVGFTWNVTRN
jgi:hypothetical protein